MAMGRSVALVWLVAATLLSISHSFMTSSPLAKNHVIVNGGRDRRWQHTGRGAHGQSNLAMMAKRDILRMPSSEPMVIYKQLGSPGQWMSISQRLNKERIIMVGRFIDEQYANQLIAMLLYFHEEDYEAPITLYFNCPGALIRPALSLYDVMMEIHPRIRTVNFGLATGMVSFLVGAGSRGDRAAMPNSRFLMQRTGMEDPLQGQAQDIAIEVSNISKYNDRMEEALVRITGKARGIIQQDFQRDFYLTATEAVAYGLIDKVNLPRTQHSGEYINSKGDPHHIVKFGAFKKNGVRRKSKYMI